jgi:amino acid adenylation domain-containing protein
MALLAAFLVLLHRYSGQDDIVVGAPTSGRQQGRFAGVIGDFVNMVPLRADLSDAPGFRALLAQVRRTVVGALAHQDFPFALMVDRLEPARDLSRPPIFQASLVLQQFHRYGELSRALLPGADETTIPFADLTLEPWPLDQQEGQFDLSLEMKEDGTGRVVGAWKYATDLFARDTVARMARHFETLMRALLAEPDRPVAGLPLLSADEAAAAEADGPVVAAPAETVLHLFEKAAARRPSATALVCGAESMTYGGLAVRVTHWAHRLAGKAVGRGDIVALMLPRGIDFVAAMLAVLKAGAAVLPLDPRHPSARIAATLQGAGVAHLIAPASDLDALDAARADTALHRIALEDLSGINGAGALPPIDGGDLAYLMPTSGSTGVPKAVMLEHRGMLNHILGKFDDLAFCERDALAQNAPQSFDVVVWQSLAPLAAGGRVVILPDAVAESPAALIDAIDAHTVTVLQVVPAMLRALIEEAAARGPSRPALAGLRWMVPTGEALPVDLCRRWFALYPHIPILNTYGSTECSDDQCHYRVDGLTPVDERAPVVAIGTPIRNMRAHVLDRNLAPVPAGVVGELYIGGAGVGRGYRNDPQRTALAFVPDPFGVEPGARLYRTRDLARRRKDGALEFLGRADQMIKLHGLRIEPGEIESALASHPAVSAAAVLACAHPSGARRLVAYVAVPPGARPPAADDLRAHLDARLPVSMMPSAFVTLDALPLTANGKLDRARLPQPDWSQGAAEAFAPPRNPREAMLATIWAAVLGRPQVSVTADFFALGGDSILSIQIATRCRRAGLIVEPRDLFLHRTVAALAERVDDAVPAPAEDAPVLPPIAADHLARAAAQVRFEDGAAYGPAGAA